MRFTTKIVILSIITISLVFFGLYGYNHYKEFFNDDEQEIFYFEKIVDTKGNTEGFPGVNISFSCGRWVEIKLINPSGEITDHNYFVTRNVGEEFFKLGGYRENVESGSYKLKIFDSNSNVVHSRNLFFNGSNLSISSCEKLCWKHQQKDYLMGLKLEVKNRGDVPVYPDHIVLQSNSDTLKGDVVPCVIQPGEEKFIYGLFCENQNTNATYNLSLFDNSDEVISSTSISSVKRSEIDTKSFKGNSFYESFTTPYPAFLHKYFKSLEIPDNDDYGLYVFDPYDDRYVDLFTDILVSSFKDDFDSLDDVSKVNYIASFVQSLNYQQDPGEIDDPRYLVETLFDKDGGVGDCEDKSILAATLLEETGFNVSLLKFSSDTSEPGHMAVGINLTADALPDKDFFQDGYYYLETTNNGLDGSNINSKKFGFKLGVVPQNLSESYKIEVFEISKRYLLNHYWKGESVTGFTNTSEGDFYKVTVIVENLGSKTAENVVIKAVVYSINKFLDQNISLKETEDKIYSLKPYDKKEVTLLLNIEKSKGDFFTTEIYVDDMLKDVCKAQVIK